MDTEFFISKYKLNTEEKEIFFSYVKNRFEDCAEIQDEDTDNIFNWEKIIEISSSDGVEMALNGLLCYNYPVKLLFPDKIKIEIYDSFAGRIPVIYVQDRSDFEQLVTNIAYKGVRPENIGSVGAFFIYGKINRFIILSSKSYSNVSAEELGLDECEWGERSMLLRREHECTHYFTKKQFGITNNILHDELIADFIGMYQTFGFYRAEWFLRFMGLIGNSGKRFLYYTEDLPDAVRAAVSDIITEASYSLEAWSKTEDFLKPDTAERIKILCKCGIMGMVSDLNN